MPATWNNHSERVMTLLRLMNDETRQSVLDALPMDVRQKLQTRIMTFSGQLPGRRTLLQLVEEFEQLFRLAQTLDAGKSARLKLSAESDEVPLVDELTGNIEADLKNINIYQLARALEEESVRAGAVLLSRVGPARSAQLLQLLPASVRKALVREMALCSAVSDHLFERVAQATLQRAIELPPVKPVRLDPVVRLADVIREVEQEQRSELLDWVRSADQDLADELQRALYRFDDLIDLDDRQVQEVLSQVDSQTLQDALFEADEAILNKILNNLSRRAAATLKEELSYQRSVPKAQLTAAREAVARTIGEVVGGLS